MRVKTCPSEQELQAFQLGDLAEPSLTDVALHLEKCPACETLAQQLDPTVDSILAGLRDPHASTGRDRPYHIVPKPSPAPAEKRATDYPFLALPQSPDELGRLGNYRVLSLVGKGGMAYVFRAEDIDLRRPVALKVMRPSQSDAEGWQRFLREARVMASIRHEHLVTVYQVGQEANVGYLAMELLEGESLATWMQKTPRAATAEVLRLAREITSALANIHGHGLIHRDIKPANIWLEAPNGRVKMLDFGLARLLDDNALLTQPGTIMGTPAFMSPEQGRGDPVDARSDLFSLGCVLYALASGEAPFHAPNTMAILAALAVKVPAPLQQIQPTVPPSLSELIMNLLAKDPNQRPASAQIVLARLGEIEERIGQIALPGPPAPAPPPAKNTIGGYFRQKGVGLAILGLGLLGALVAWLNMPSAKPPESAPVYVSEMEEVEPRNWPFSEKVPQKPRDEPSDWPAPKGGARVYIKDQVSLHGIFTHLPPPLGGTVSISYRLDKKFQIFQTEISLNDGPANCIPLTFAIYGDGKQLWKSKPVTVQADTQSCSISVKEVQTLRLEVTAEGEVRGTHGVWIEPRLTK